MNNLLDYTKFKLKPEKEILPILDKKIFILTCKKCFKEFQITNDSEFDKLKTILDRENITIAGNFELDFLCNLSFNEKKLKQIDLSEISSVGVISCGIGVQVLSDFFNEAKIVYSLADSFQNNSNATAGHSYHGISLSQQKCSACSQCYLGLTGGICPIVDCSKSLLNGPCGGAKNGKCEVKIDGKQKDCAWEKIYNKLNKTNRINFTVNLPVQLRDFSKPTITSINKYKNLNREKRLQNFYGGLYPYERKEITKDIPIKQFPEPDIVIIPLSQHTGSPSKPTVQVGQKVKIGQKIGESTGFISSNIHSSVSGKVIAIEERTHPVLQKKVLSIVIENDKKNELFKETGQHRKNIDSLNKNELLEIIKENGIVGLGGAMFPTNVKLQPPKPVDILIINGCECEPYLTSDYRMMIEKTDEILEGIKILKKILELKKIIIAIEDNKQEAIDRFRVKSSEFEVEIDVVSLKTKYPQGAEKMLIKKITGREVPIDGLPFDVGIIVQNVSTVYAIYQAVIEGIPLIKRVITVSGENCTKPGNYEIKIGTPIKNIINYCFSLPYSLLSAYYSLKMGGPMMGIIQTDFDAPVIKGTTGIILIKNPDIQPDENRKCIKCGRCVDVCPMELTPLYYVLYSQEKNWQKTLQYNVKSCIECGCCEYICSSKIPIVKIVKKAKECRVHSS
ncbi:MAG: electron transport complex subunit RsxC [Endomicrobiia bacterium]